MIWRLRNREIHFPRRPLVMGIVNVNDDSFCGDGSLDPTAALAQARLQLREGADVIDLGAESARTNRQAISTGEEVRRLLPLIATFKGMVDEFGVAPFDQDQVWPPLLSINTWRPEVIRAVLPHGGDLINDISALPDDTNARLCAKHGASLLIMHSVGQPKVAHTHVRYQDIMAALDAFFEEKIALATMAGLERERIILDPGIDFAKQRDDNLTIYRHLKKLARFDRPLLVPVSRKTVIGEVLGLSDPLQRDAGTVACVAAGMLRGAHLFRVHNVRATVEAVKTLWGIVGRDAPAGLSAF